MDARFDGWMEQRALAESDLRDVRPFPMPNDKIEERTVVASVEYFDDERGVMALVLLLNAAKPFFTVAHYAQTRVFGDENTTEYQEGELDVIGDFENIVPAVREYEQNGGDY